MLSSSNGLDILGTCETFLNITIPDDVLTVAGYTLNEKIDPNLTIHQQ